MHTFVWSSPSSNWGLDDSVGFATLWILKKPIQTFFLASNHASDYKQNCGDKTSIGQCCPGITKSQFKQSLFLVNTLLHIQRATISIAATKSTHTNIDPFHFNATIRIGSKENYFSIFLKTSQKKTIECNVHPKIKWCNNLVETMLKKSMQKKN